LKVIAFILVLVIGVISVSCAHGGPGSQSGAAGASNAANNNGQPRILFTEQSARGDIERAGYAVDSAIDSLRQNKTNDALGYLEAASKHLEKAMGEDRPDHHSVVRLGSEINAAKTLLDSAINSARGGSADVKSKIEQARVALNTLKVQMPT
jgi:hypothetical protein